MQEHEDHRTPFHWIYAGTMTALCVWGSVLAYGAYVRSDDPRKGWIVLGCELAFLAFWGFVLWHTVGRGHRRTPTNSSTPNVARRNMACRLAWWVAVAGMTILVLLIAGLIHPATRLAAIARGAIVVTGLVAAVASLVGLSNPERSADKWMGFAALSLCFIGPVLWFVSALAM